MSWAPSRYNKFGGKKNREGIKNDIRKWEKMEWKSIKNGME